LGRHKIIGQIECPHVDKSGNSCRKLGRYNSTITAWNTRHQFARKKQYVQFMHNDCSKKHYIPLKTYASEKYRGHFFEKELNIWNELASTHEDMGTLWKKAAENIIGRHHEKFTDSEKIDLQNMFLALDDISKKHLESLMLQKLINVDYLMKGKIPPDEITDRLKQISRDLGNINQIQIFLPLINIFSKYEVPRRNKKWKIANDKQKNWPLGSTHIRKGVMG
jgi:hypothetical protein